MLEQLIKEQIDPNPALRKQLVSAMLLGGNVIVPKGKTEGGDVQEHPRLPERRRRRTAWSRTRASSKNRRSRRTSDAWRPAARRQPPPKKKSERRSAVREPGAARPGQPARARCCATSRRPPSRGCSANSSRCPKHRLHGWPTRVSTPANASAPTAPLVAADRRRRAAGHRANRSTEVLGPLWGTHLEDVNVALGNLVGMTAIEVGDLPAETPPPPPPAPAPVSVPPPAALPPVTRAPPLPVVHKVVKPVTHHRVKHKKPKKRQEARPPRQARQTSGKAQRRYLHRASVYPDARLRNRARKGVGRPTQRSRLCRHAGHGHIPSCAALARVVRGPAAP